MSKSQQSAVDNKQQFLRIDNPGQGDCGYYALAMGIIYLAKEHQVNAPIEQWKLLDLTVANHLDDITQNSIPEASIKWRNLQLSLRRLLYKQIEAKCPERYDQFIGQTPHEDLCDLVENYIIRYSIYPLQVDNRQNALVHSKPVQSVVIAIREALAQIQYPNNHLIKRIAHDEFIVAALIKFREVVLNAYQSHYIGSHSWATEQEIRTLAECLGVQSVFYTNGHISGGMGDLPLTPHVILNNEYNYHWTLFIPKVKPVFQALPEDELRVAQPLMAQQNANPPEVQQNPLGYEEIVTRIDHQITQLQENKQLPDQDRLNQIKILRAQREAELQAIKEYVRAQFAGLLQNLTPQSQVRWAPPVVNENKKTYQKLRKKRSQIPYAGYCLNASVFGLFFGGIAIAAVPQLVMTTMATLALSQVSAMILIMAASMFMATLITFNILILADSFSKTLASK